MDYFMNSLSPSILNLWLLLRIAPISCSYHNGFSKLKLAFSREECWRPLLDFRIKKVCIGSRLLVEQPRCSKFTRVTRAEIWECPTFSSMAKHFSMLLYSFLRCLRIYLDLSWKWFYIYFTSMDGRWSHLSITLKLSWLPTFPRLENSNGRNFLIMSFFIIELKWGKSWKVPQITGEMKTQMNDRTFT